MSSTIDDPKPHLPLSPLDLHVLLVLAGSELYGYAIMKAVEDESAGALRPDVGSLYRVLARLDRDGLVEEAGDRVPDDENAPGRPRRYYRITPLGRSVVAAEVSRLRRAIDLAVARELLPIRGGLS